MASAANTCKICDLPALLCCSECDAKLCFECKEHHSASTTTRNHNIVPISEYENLIPTLVERTQFCKKHSEKYQQYCKKHERPCCQKCVIQAHLDCNDITPLDNVTSAVKASNAFYEIEQMLTEIYVNIQRIRSDRHENLERLTDERKKIEQEIQNTRLKVNVYLDKLQESMTKELHEAETKQRNAIRQLLESLDEKANEISKYQEELINVKNHASDLQTFLVMKQMEIDIEEKNELLTLIFNSGQIKRVNLSFKINDELLNALRGIHTFGKLEVEENPPGIVVVRKKDKQAQISIPHFPPTSIFNVSLNLQQTINTQLRDIGGCTLLPNDDGRMIFSCYSEHRVIVLKKDGSTDFDILLPSSRSCDLTYIKNNNTIAVTSGGGDKRIISIIDVKSRSLVNTIPSESYNDGIINRNNTLIFCARGDGLRMMNLTNLSVSCIVSSKLSMFAYITIFDDKLYYTNFNSHTVTCCDLNGKTQWKFQDKGVINGPLGISVDNEGNVYVFGYYSHNLVVIIPDGLRHRQLLSDKNGLLHPRVLHYDRDNNKVLVANENGTAFLFLARRLL